MRYWLGCQDAEVKRWQLHLWREAHLSEKQLVSEHGHCVVGLCLLAPLIVGVAMQ